MQQRLGLADALTAHGFRDIHIAPDGAVVIPGNDRQTIATAAQFRAA